MRATAAPPASTSITALLPQPLPFLGGGCCATGRLVPGFTLGRAGAGLPRGAPAPPGDGAGRPGGGGGGGGGGDVRTGWAAEGGGAVGLSEWGGLRSWVAP